MDDAAALADIAHDIEQSEQRFRTGDQVPSTTWSKDLLTAAVDTLATLVAPSLDVDGVNPLEASRTLLACGVAQRLAHEKRASRETLEAAVAALDRCSGPWPSPTARSRS